MSALRTTRAKGQVWVDLHMHSSASFDCSVGPSDLARRCAEIGLSPIFLTDHNTIDGAKELSKPGAARLITGEEIMSAEGEIIGLFLTERVPQGLSALETVALIKGQGGLVYLEHPYDPYRRPLKVEAIELVADQIDIVEVFNGRSDQVVNSSARDLCHTLGAAPGAGSDAHTLDEIGSVRIRMRAFDGPEDFLQKLRDSRIFVRRGGFWRWVGHGLRQVD